MPESTTIHLRFDDTSHEEIPAVRVRDRWYRLQATPLLSPEPIHAGDVIEVALLEDGTHRFLRVVERPAVRHYSWVVPRGWLQSPDRHSYIAKVEAVGGTWEQELGGVLHVHIPTEAPFDAEAELDRYLRSDWPEA